MHPLLCQADQNFLVIGRSKIEGHLFVACWSRDLASGSFYSSGEGQDLLVLQLHIFLDRPQLVHALCL